MRYSAGSLLLISVIVFVMVSNLYAEPSDTLWTKTYGGTAYDMARCIQQTSDGGYVITGCTESFGTGGLDIWLLKTDANADTVWTQTYGGSADEIGYFVQQTSDEGFIITGYTQSYGAGGTDIWLLRTNAIGELLWAQTYGGAEDDSGQYVDEIDDGYIVAGTTKSYSAGLSDFWLIKTDQSGDTIWTITYGGGDRERCYTAQRTSDGGYILGGDTGSYGSGEVDMYMVKVDADGNFEWHNYFGQSQTERCTSIIQTSDGGYMLAGQTWSYASYGKDVFLVKTDSAGDPEWQDIYGIDWQDEGRSVIQTPDNGFVIGGWTCPTYVPVFDYKDMYVMKTDQSGNLLWQETYGGPGIANEEGLSLIQNSNGRFIIAGSTESYGAGSADIWIVSLEGEPPPLPQYLTLTPYGSGIVIPPGGGYFYFNLDVTNDNPLPLTFDLWVVAEFPIGTEYCLIGPLHDLFLAGNSSQDRDQQVYVPAVAPAGQYTCKGFMGDYPFSVLDADSFMVEKVGSDSEAGNAGDWLITSPHPFETREGVADCGISKPISISPNPFNPSTTLIYQIPSTEFIELTIYDIAGRPITTLVEGWREAGAHQVTFDASGLPSGVYLARLQTSEVNAIKKMVLVK